MNYKKTAAFFLLFTTLFLSLFLFFSCAYGLNEFLYRGTGVDERSKKIKDETLPSVVASSFTFIVVTDVHFGSDKKRLDENFWARLRELDVPGQRPAFVIVLGDIAEHGEEDEFKQYAAFVKKIKTFGVSEVYGVVGNHDLYNSGWKHWRTYVRPNNFYYRFKTNRFSWYFIDTGNGTLGEPQLKNLVKEMEKDTNPKFVFSHYPLYGGRIPYFVLSDPKERAVLIDTFTRNNVKMMFSGHFHRGRPVYNYGNFSEAVLRSFIDYGSWVEVLLNENDLSFSLTERN